MSIVPQSGEGLGSYLRRVLGNMVTSVRTSGNIQARIDGNTLSISVPNQVSNRPFFAKITGVSGAAYAWTEQWQTSATAWADLPNGRSGTTSANSAYEINGALSVPINAIVIMYATRPSDNSASVYQFFYGPPPSVFAVKVEQTGGSNGTKTTPATYTYTVRTLGWNGTSGGSSLGTGVQLARPRPNGRVTVQAGSTGYGLAFYDGTSLKLWDAGEIPGTTTTCPS